MAQSGYTPILIYGSGTATNVPLAADLTSTALGVELALNYADGKLYYKNSSGVVTLLATAALASLTLPVSLANGGTAATSAPAAMASLIGFTTTATAAGTTTLTNASSYYQLFTGSTTQTVVLPVTSTLAQGWSYHIVNNSTGNVSVQSSGTNAVITVLPGTTAMCTCILTSGTTAASWEAGLTDFSTATGTGAVVLGTSPILVTPTINDTNSVAIQTYSTTASAVNYLALANSATGAAPTFTATGSDTNISITLAPKGTGELRDSKGKVRAIPQSGSDKTSSYTLAIGDVGQFIGVGTSGAIVVPASVFSTGDVISVYNNTTGNVTITCSAVTSYISGTNTVKTSVTLATRGVATILYTTASQVVIAGSVS